MEDLSAKAQALTLLTEGVFLGVLGKNCEKVLLDSEIYIEGDESFVKSTFDGAI